MTAVARALPTLQMISGDGNFSSKTASFTSELKNYTVVSIIGSQGGGKSYLLNSLFGTGFDVLNPEGGRKQTTKGIWIAKCINPGMVIMDVEGSDGNERGQFSMAADGNPHHAYVCYYYSSDQHFTTVGLENGGNIPLIKTFFKERINIEATKTNIIVVVRDYDYETPVHVTTKQIHDTMNGIWQNVHQENKKMSDYVEVTVRDFPHAKRDKSEFSRKCQDLLNLLRSFAANENLEEEYYVSDFAKSSALIWDLIRSNRELIAADHMVAKSKYFCKKARKSLVRSLDEGKTRDLMDDLTISPKDFLARFSSVRNNILTRYEEKTASYLITVRDKKKVKLMKQLEERFRKGFGERLDYLANKLLESARENLKPALKKYKRPDNDAIIEVMQPYVLEFANNTPSSAEDLKCPEDLLRELEKKLEYFLSELLTLAKEKASKIKLKRGLITAATAALGLTTMSIGTVWASCTLDPSLIIAGATITCAAAKNI